MMVPKSFLFIGLMVLVTVKGFAPFVPHQRVSFASSTGTVSSSAMFAKKKKRRRRKQPPGSPPVSKKEEPKVEKPMIAEVASFQMESDGAITEDGPPLPKADIKLPTDDGPPKDEKSMIAEIASFQFEPDDAITEGVKNEQSGGTSSDDPLVLPDIKDQLRKKQVREEMERLEEEKLEKVEKIKRSDIKAFTKLLETQPYADADDSFFEAEEYGTVSALLGENAKSFLGIPPGPLQVGHFIGALVICLMAFVEYPGFPLTNLPSPIRSCFQGGLLTIYLINAALAVAATFKAGERGQSKVLWGIKTFSVGGLAFDQLTQLPTLAQVEEAKSRKGKRALKKR